ncbi:uncharacterized protein NPIL_697521 [Nephila pilipes]|uniref:Ionotropic glutamate receptor L-glutamate and glycine-binding domain-containing protein n=1 Tax=Nephila pilipes TaxID=299642 RepID=A0A8X6MJV2_NEPPI|nr:uncharacterized protein NPIL_697521 [Nephila pilipes]
MESCKKWTIATLNRSKMFEIHPSTNGKPNISGIEGEFIKIILDKVNIDYEVVIPRDNEYGRELTSGNWTGLIGMVHRGEADIAVANLGIYEDRYRTIDFSFSYVTDELIFVILKASKQWKLFSLLRIFGIRIWISIFCALFLITTIIYVFFKGNETYFNVLFNLATNMLRQPLNLHKNMHKRKLIVCTWMLFAFIMSSIHSATLLSFIAFPSEPKTVENLRELSEALAKGTHSVYGLKGSNYMNLLLNFKDEYLQLIGSKIVENQWYITAEELSQNPLKNESSAVLGPADLFNLLYGFGEIKSKVLFSKDKVISGALAFAIRRGFCCTSQLNGMVGRLTSSGIYSKLLRDESVRHWLSVAANEKKNEETQVLTVHHFYTAFIFLFIGLSTSLMAFLGEILCFYVYKKTNFQKHNTLNRT